MQLFLKATECSSSFVNQYIQKENGLPSSTPIPNKHIKRTLLELSSISFNGSRNDKKSSTSKSSSASKEVPTKRISDSKKKLNIMADGTINQQEDASCIDETNKTKTNQPKQQETKNNSYQMKSVTGLIVYFMYYIS